MKLSVVKPIYNEIHTLEELIYRVERTNLADEIILVDDGSNDRPREIVEGYQEKAGFKVVIHTENQGKGAAVRNGFDVATGDVILIRDADLEFDPRDYAELLKPNQDGLADVVYGSRFLGASRRVAMFWHMVANKLLTCLRIFFTIPSDRYGNRI